MGKMYRTMQGKQVDMERLMSQNELMPAVGNVRVNARGDELGAGGKIIKKREEVIAEYYESNPKAVPDQSRIVKTAAAVDKKTKPADKEEE
jgi:hypothetical protein